MASPGSSSNANVSQVTDDVDPPAASSTIQPRSDAAQVRPHSPPMATKWPASLGCRDASSNASPAIDDDVRIDPPATRRRSGSDPGRGGRLGSVALGKASPGHLSPGGRRGRSRPLTDTATAAMHMARTAHQRVFDDSPSPSDAGNVLTRLATNGRRVGAIRISATAPETGAPGSP